MSCFDMVMCKLELLGETPTDNQLTEDMFQIKEFGCTGSTYEINEDKELVLKIDRSNGVDKDLHLGYTGELELVGRASDYIAVFKDGKFVSAERLVEVALIENATPLYTTGAHADLTQACREETIALHKQLGLELPKDH